MISFFSNLAITPPPPHQTAPPPPPPRNTQFLPSLNGIKRNLFILISDSISSRTTVTLTKPRMSSTGTVRRIVSETYMEELNILTSVVIVTVLLTQPALTASDTQNFTLGVFIPRTGALTLGPETETAVRWTVERLNARFSSRFHFEYTIKDTECNKDAALTKFVEMLCERSRLLSHIHAIIGKHLARSLCVL